MTEEKQYRWRLNFVLIPPVPIGEVRNLQNVKIVKESDSPDAKAKSIEVELSESTQEKAIKNANEVAIRCVDYLAYLTGSAIDAKLSNCKNLDDPKPAHQWIHPVGISSTRIARPNVDISVEPVSGIIYGNEPDLSVQLYHYHLAVRAEGIVTRIEELFQVLEHEYSRNNQTIKKYRLLRDAVLHPKLRNEEVRQFLISKLGTDQITSQEQLELFWPEAREMKAKVDSLLRVKTRRHR